MIQKATKKPITIEFVRYDGENHEEIIAFTNGAAQYEEAVGGDDQGNGHPQLYTRLVIPTNEGEMLCSEGDLVIKEPFPTTDRIFYPCKPDIFNQTYDIDK